LSLSAGFVFGWPDLPFAFVQDLCVAHDDWEALPWAMHTQIIFPRVAQPREPFLGRFGLPLLGTAIVAVEIAGVIFLGYGAIWLVS